MWITERKTFTLSYRLQVGLVCIKKIMLWHCKSLIDCIILNPQQSSQYPAYVLSAASVVPGAGVVMGTSSGRVYLVKSSTKEPQSLSTMDSIPGQVNQLVYWSNKEYKSVCHLTDYTELFTIFSVSVVSVWVNSKEKMIHFVSLYSFCCNRQNCPLYTGVYIMVERASKL